VTALNAAALKVQTDKPQTLEALVAIVTATPEKVLADKLPDLLFAAGWEVFGDGDHSWQATSKTGEHIHLANGQLHAGAWKEDQ
jgi:hypothetical protein